MRSRTQWGLVGAVLLSAATPSFGQASATNEAAPPAAAVPAPTPEPAPVVPPQTANARVIPAGTLIAVRLEAAMSSRTAVNDEMFPISLLVPIRLGDEEIVPAGTPGMGQVVHSAGRGFGGRAGELILAARFLQWGDRRIPLRGMRISATGRNNAAEAILISSTLLTVGGLFVTGTSVDLSVGHEAVARLAQDLVLDPPAETAPAAPVTNSTQPTETAPAVGAVQPQGEDR
jgi:hypothetical protein